MNVHEFIQKWSRVSLTERSASQQHFLDLCELLGHPKPAAADPRASGSPSRRAPPSTAAARAGPTSGSAASSAGSTRASTRISTPPTTSSSSTARPSRTRRCWWSATWTASWSTPTSPAPGQTSRHPSGRSWPSRAISRSCAPSSSTPRSSSPGVTSEADHAGGRGARWPTSPRRCAPAGSTPRRGPLPRPHRLLPVRRGRRPPPTGDLFTEIVRQSRRDPALFSRFTDELFAGDGRSAATSARTASATSTAISSTTLRCSTSRPRRWNVSREAAKLDWSAVDPSIFGTLFERGMDPDKRSQLGAHYTSREDIETLVEPVVMQPLRREWAEVRRGRGEPACHRQEGADRQARRSRKAASRERPAQGESGVGSDPPALPRAARPGQGARPGLRLGQLPLRHASEAQGPGEGGDPLRRWSAVSRAFIPHVGPWQLYGIEINPYAFELAQMTVWIGYLQWIKQQRLRRARGAGAPAHGQLPVQGRDPRPLRPGEPQGAGVAEGGFHRRQPAVPGRQNAARGSWGTSTLTALFQVWKERVPRSRSLLLLVRESATADRSRPL